MIEILRGASAFLGALLAVAYLYQFVYLFVPFFKKRRAHHAAVSHRYAVLIAARNEEAVLPHLLRSIRAQDYPAELVDTFVIADNCTDRTAAPGSIAGSTGRRSARATP